MSNNGFNAVCMLCGKPLSKKETEEFGTVFHQRCPGDESKMEHLKKCTKQQLLNLMKVNLPPKILSGFDNYASNMVASNDVKKRVKEGEKLVAKKTKIWEDFQKQFGN